MTDVGTNLSPVIYWSSEYPFIDRIKSAGEWAVLGSSDPLPLDANGYPKSTPTGATVYAMVSIDPPSANTDRNYVLTYTGTATFLLGGATIISSEPGKIVFHYFSDKTMEPLILNSMDSNDPITSMHLVREDQAAAFQNGAIFNQAFLDKTSVYDTLRFMDWTNTNNTQIVNWADRPQTNDMTWGADGVPIEVQVALANTLHKNMWINIPTKANDDYVTKTLQYIKANLDPSLTVNVEYSNEVWNSSFSASSYAQTQANALWAVDSNGNGKIDSSEAIVNGNEQYYGYRAAQVAAITQQVFGTSTQAQVVLATFTAYTGIESYIFDGVARANVGSVSSLFDDYAITTYFGDNLGGSNAADRATVLSWAKSGAAGLDAAFNELKYGNTLDTSYGSLAALLPIYQYQANVAAQYGLNLVAYEGGLGLTASGYAQADQQTIMDFFGRLEADPRIGVLYNEMVADFGSLGGSELNVYTDSQADNVFGIFGTLKSIYGTSYAYEALAALDVSSAGQGASTTLASYVFNSTEANITYIGGGAFTGIGNALANVITGGDAGNTLSGGAGNDTLRGGKGSDYLDGGSGADTMSGGAGDDTYAVDDAGDMVVELVNGGTDTVKTSLSSYTLGNNLENLTATGLGSFAGTGNTLDNVITGSVLGNNVLTGGGGNDTLYGGAGNDLLDGGIGDDRMVGGLGNDVYRVDTVGDVVVELPGGGTDEVRTTLNSYALGANLENLTYGGTAAFTGTGNALDNVITGGNGGNTLRGGLGNDTLVGGSGNDYLDGGTGNDAMQGGNGNDIYIVDSVGDSVTEASNNGIDEVRTTLATYTLGANVENLTNAGTLSATLTGNALDNVLRAGNSTDRLYGGDGNDTLYGGDSADLLDGGTGADYMAGGLGNDVYWVDNGYDAVVEQANQGTADRVKTTLNAYTLTDNVEQLVFLGTGSFNGTGNALDNLIAGGNNGNSLSGGGGNDTLTGGNGNDTFDGGTGADTMTGGLGDDTYFVDNVGDVVVENPLGGTDTVYSSISYTLGVNVENLSLIGTGAINGTGNAFDNFMVGNSAANTLTGGLGNDYILAADGNDILDGGDGRDILFGQNGNDTLYGGAGNDALYGGDGNDILVGGAGQEWLEGDAGADRFVFKAGDLGNLLYATDQIADFSHSDGDKIDLSGYDAIAYTGTVDPFTFIGSSNFSNHAGELRVDNVGGFWNVMGDTNGDGIADFVLNVTSPSALVASDFIGVGNGGVSLAASGLSLTTDETAAATSSQTRSGYSPMVTRKMEWMMSTDMLL